MIILTSPDFGIKKYKRISSVVEYGGMKYCLMELDVDDLPIDNDEHSFWWELGPGYIDCEAWSYDSQWLGGMVEGIDLLLSLGKEKNVACSVYQLAQNAGEDPFDLWENHIHFDQLTVAQALEKGYEYYGFEDERFQSLSEVKTAHEDIDFKRKVFLFSKNPNASPSISEEELKDLVSEHIEQDHEDQTGDDTGTVTDLLSTFDFKDFADKINKHIESITTYGLTKTELIP